MKVEVGKILINKTAIYLRPVLKAYDESFLRKLSGVFKTGIGYQDVVFNFTYPDIMDDERYIFYLLDTQSTTFLSFMKWIVDHPAYKTDYPYDDLYSGRLHMVVFIIPEQYNESYDHFTNGNYSKMFTTEQLKELRISDIRLSVYLKEPQAIKQFIQKVNEEYDTTYNWEDWQHEADFPPFEVDETFNFGLTLYKR